MAPFALALEATAAATHSVWEEVCLRYFSPRYSRMVIVFFGITAGRYPT